MTRAIDITGVRFGKLVAIKRVGKNKFNHWLWHCQCDCGGTTTLFTGRLRAGVSQSCGCGSCIVYKHGHTKTHPLFHIWASMRQRCNNPNTPAYKWYGARGIKICNRWDNFAVFLSDVGERPHPKLTLDRIDVNGNYEPNNVKWATHKEQMANQRRKNIDQFTTKQLEQELARRRRNHALS